MKKAIYFILAYFSGFVLPFLILFWTKLDALVKNPSTSITMVGVFVGIILLILLMKDLKNKAYVHPEGSLPRYWFGMIRILIITSSIVGLIVSAQYYITVYWMSIGIIGLCQMLRFHFNHLYNQDNKDLVEWKEFKDRMKRQKLARKEARRNR